MRLSSLSERLRRAVTNDDLPSAQRVYARIQAQHGLPLVTYTDGESGGELDVSMKELFSRTIRNEEMELLHYESAQSGPSSQPFHNTSRPLMSADVLGDCLALSATQLSIARQSRLRERNREAVKAKSSLAIAVEKGAGIDMVQWLLDMGHERGDFSRDMRGCTIVSLAAQHNRTDVIEACCIDAVAHAATLHHQRSLIYGIPYGFHYHIADEDDEEEHRLGTIPPYDDNLALHADDAHRISSSGIVTPEGAMSPALTLVTAAASTPSRRPSPKPIRLNNRTNVKQHFHEARSTASTDHNHASAKFDGPTEGKNGGKDEDSGEDALSLGGSSEMDDIVGVTTQRLLDCPDELGRTGLALASMKGHEQAVRLLIDLGASLDVADYEGNRPLHYASAYNQLIIVQMLIEGGCSYLAKNTLGFTPADYAFSASLKSALEAFARTQFDSTRVRQRIAEHSSPSLNDSASTSSQNAGNQVGSTTRQSLDTTVKNTSSNVSPPATAAASSTSVIGLFPTSLRENPPTVTAQVKLSSQLRDIF